MKFRQQRKLRVRATLDLTPLINVVLLLLLFFMLSSTFVAQNVIPIQAAVTEGAPAYVQQDITVTLVRGDGGPGGKGPVYVNDVPMADMGELSRMLAEARAQRPDLKVLIRPDARLETSRLIEVLSVAGAAGIERYAIAAEPAVRPQGK